jgi:stearoyl-CoA desaturase (delta-9 desaturase)
VNIIVPTLGAVAATALAFEQGVRTIDIVLLCLLYAASMLGVTLGYHRLFAHRSFVANRTTKAVLAMLGSAAAQGPLFFWTAVHRRHHQRSDQFEDPHSPLTPGDLKLTARGFWHAHVGWMFQHQPLKYRKLIPDLLGDPMLRRIDRLYPMWVLAGLLVPSAIGGLVSQSWAGAVLGFLWGGLLRIFIAHHVTWCINSVSHVLGTRPFNTPDRSRNNFVLAVLTFGEGWHNNHHARPASARHGIHWWQLDLVYYIVCFLEWVGAVSGVKGRTSQTALRTRDVSIVNRR